MSTGRAHPPLPVLPQRHGFSRSCLTHSPVHCQAGVGWIGGIRTYVCKLDGIVTESKCVCVCVCVCVCERERERPRGRVLEVVRPICQRTLTIPTCAWSLFCTSSLSTVTRRFLHVIVG